MQHHQEDRVALVTGGTRGIGRAVVDTLIRERLASGIVINHFEDCDNARRTQEELSSRGVRIITCQADVSDRTAVEKMFEDAAGEFGRLDILINNAGITSDRSFRKMSFDDWDRVLAVNLTGVFNCCKLAAEAMLKQKWGRIINLSSVIGQYGNFGQTNYAAAKAGVIGFTKALAVELSLKGITVNAIAPGFIDTRMTENIPPSAKEKIMERITLKRFGKSAEVAELTAFLASERSSYITGQVFNVDGGYQ